MSDPLPIDLAFTWRYRHALGALAPFFDGLGAGRAVAARCRTCARAWFPPRADCAEHGGSLEWVDLSGEGTVIALTDGTLARPPSGAPAPARIALVSLDGAENAAIGPVVGDLPVTIGSRVRLERADGPIAHPIQAMQFRAIVTPRR